MWLFSRILGQFFVAIDNDSLMLYRARCARF
nr:MAG TPA: hypothetical protein [Caudoviricetes sp.]